MAWGWVKKRLKSVGRAAGRVGAAGLDVADTVLRAPARILRPVPVLGRIADAIPNIRDPLAPVFEGVVASNVLAAQDIAIPAEWTTWVRGFMTASPSDADWLGRGLRQAPRFHSGGWIMGTAPASAMTMDDDVFVNKALYDAGAFKIKTYAHELVHVGQYKVLGRTAFLTSYYGLSAATIAYRWARGQPINAMRSSPQETSAYAIEGRFCAWLSTQPGAPSC